MCWTRGLCSLLLPWWRLKVFSGGRESEFWYDFISFHICGSLNGLVILWPWSQLTHDSTLSCFRAYGPYSGCKRYFHRGDIAYGLQADCVIIIGSRSWHSLSHGFGAIADGAPWSVSLGWVAPHLGHFLVRGVLIWTWSFHWNLSKCSFRISDRCSWEPFKMSYRDSIIRARACIRQTEMWREGSAFIKLYSYWLMSSSKRTFAWSSNWILCWPWTYVLCDSCQK